MARKWVRLKQVARAADDIDSGATTGAGMPSEPVQTLYPISVVAEQIDVEIRADAPRVSLVQRLRASLSACRRLMAGNGHAVAAHDTDGLACAEGSAHAMVGERSITQINDSDREYLNAFSSLRKGQVMEAIMSLTPVLTVVCQGRNQLEKSVFNLHREGYGLIDIQPQENAFTTVWYRKTASFLSKSADVTMLLWEEREQGDAVTLMSWKI